MPRSFVASTLAGLALVSGCGGKECVTGDEDACVISSPCQGVGSTCSGGFAVVRVLEASDPVPLGGQALGLPGDFVLENDAVIAVIDGIGHPHHLAPTGGSSSIWSLRARASTG